MFYSKIIVHGVLGYPRVHGSRRNVKKLSTWWEYNKWSWWIRVIRYGRITRCRLDDELLRRTWSQVSKNFTWSPTSIVALMYLKMFANKYSTLCILGLNMTSLFILNNIFYITLFEMFVKIWLPCLKKKNYTNAFFFYARFFAPDQTGPGAHSASCTVGIVSHSVGKRPRRGTDHQPHLALRLMKEYSYTFPLSLGLHGLL